MPEEAAVYQVYEHRGNPLNLTIIKAILRKCLVDREIHTEINPQQNSLSVHEFKENISAYHERNGGAPIQLEDTYTPFYNALCKLEEQGSAERHRDSERHYWKLIPIYRNNTSVERLVDVLRQERNHLTEVVEALNQRKAELDEILSEFG